MVHVPWRRLHHAAIHCAAREGKRRVGIRPCPRPCARTLPHTCTCPRTIMIHRILALMRTRCQRLLQQQQAAQLPVPGHRLQRAQALCHHLAHSGRKEFSVTRWGTRVLACQWPAGGSRHPGRSCAAGAFSPAQQAQPTFSAASVGWGRAQVGCVTLRSMTGVTSDTVPSLRVWHGSAQSCKGTAGSAAKAAKAVAP